MEAWEITVLAIYGAALLFIFSHSLVQLNLVMLYRKARKKLITSPLNTPEVSDEQLPVVTVQLPLYNEMYVVERLIDAVAAFDYPVDKLEIQVLDDSNDETIDIVAAKVKEWQLKGLDIKQVRRPQRVGYKAGALDYGQKIARGEFIAIFDADFLPPADFLRKTIPHFNESNVGVVQTSWGHINENYSLLTKMQAFGLNAHFTVEQTGRNHGGHFLNFNGTAGVWRKSCIDDAGGWEYDTITEDLDLSYRAQLKGWKIQYLEDIVSPAELPAAMNAFKSQQFRWTKGAAETFRKHFINVLKAPIPFKTKLHAAFHLTNSALFICIMCCAILSVPTLIIKHNEPELKILFQISSGFVASLFILIMFYWNSMRKEYEDGLETTLAFIPRFMLFLSVSMGMSLHNAIAVIEGYLGRKTPFVRTPKFALRTKSDTWKKAQYLTERISPITLLEGAMAVYFGWAMYLGIKLNDLGLFPFHAMLAVGFSLVFVYSIRHARG